MICKDNANREQNIKSHLNVMLRCSLSYAKIMLFIDTKKVNCLLLLLPLQYNLNTKSQEI